MRKRVFFAGIILAIVVSVSLVGAFSYVEIYPFRHDLSVRITNQTDSGLPEYDCGINITDADIVVGNIYFRLEPQYYSNWEHPASLDVQHIAGTELDTVAVTFEVPNNYATIYYSGEQSTQYIYTRTPETQTMTIHVNNNLGSMWGATNYKFIVPTPNSYDNTLKVTVDVSMHYNTPLQLTELYAHAVMDIQIVQQPPKP
jgi:hypothetical protein